MATATLELAYTDQPNMAPAEVIRKKEKRAPTPVKFETWIAGKYTELRNQDDDVWREVYSVCEMMVRFYSGQHLLRRNTLGYGWKRYDKMTDTGSALIRAFNFTRFYVDNVIAKWVQSSADLIVHPARDTDEAQGQARAADVILEHYENDWYTPEFRQTEALLATLTGNYYRRIYYSKGKTVRARTPVLGDKTIGGGGMSTCADCGWAGDPGDVEMMDGACPSCGAPDVVTEEVPELAIKEVIGNQDEEVGDLVCESVPIFNLRYELSQALECSPWMIYERRVRMDVLDNLFEGRMEIPAADDDNYGLETGQSLSRAGMAVGGRNGSNLSSRRAEKQSLYADLAEMWLTPDMYRGVLLEEAIETVSGQVIPAGKLIDTFPDGMCVVAIDKCSTVLFLYNEDHRDHWLSAQYHQMPFSGVGDGVADIIEPQRQLNVGNSMLWAQIRAGAMPGHLFDKDLISGDEVKLIGQPQVNIPVDLSRLPDQRGLKDAVWQVPASSPSPHAVDYIHNFLNNAMQFGSQVTDFSNGLPGVNNSTATGAQISAANAQSLHSPRLQLLASMNCRTARLALKLYQRDCPEERYFRIANKRGRQDGMWLKAGDIAADVFIEIQPESYLPQSGLERRERLTEFLSIFGTIDVLMLAMQQNPTLVNQLARRYDVDLEAADYSVMALIGRKRIEQMKAILPTLMQMSALIPPDMLDVMQTYGVNPDVMAGNMLLMGIDPQPDIRELGHDAYVNYYQDWLTTDEGMTQPAPLREAVKGLIDAHRRFMVMGLDVAAGIIPPPIGANGLPLGMSINDPTMAAPMPGVPLGPTASAPQGQEQQQGAPGQEEAQGGQQQQIGQQQPTGASPGPTTSETVKNQAAPNYSGGGPAEM